MNRNVGLKTRWGEQEREAVKEEEETEMEGWEGEEVMKKKKTNGEGWQMVTFNNGDGEVAISWIMPNQNKGCFQRDVLLEACALASDTQADTCTHTHKHIRRAVAFYKNDQWISCEKSSSPVTDAHYLKTKPQSSLTSQETTRPMRSQRTGHETELMRDKHVQLLRKESCRRQKWD